MKIYLSLFASAALIVTLLCAVRSDAQQLSLRHYGVADGLASGEVTSIYQDRKGFVWLSTFEGVSRFDGYSFTTYGVQDGLPHPITNHITEDRQGRLWIATNGGGVARLLDPPQESGSPSAGNGPTVKGKFVSFLIGDLADSNKVNRLLFDARGTLWCLTDFGLYRGRGDADDRWSFEAVQARKSYDADAICEDRQGRLWFGVGDELIEVNQEQVIHHGLVGGVKNEPITGIIESAHGGLRISTWYRLFEWAPKNHAEKDEALHRLPLGLRPGQVINEMLEDAVGGLWIGTNYGLLKYQNQQPTAYATADGLEVFNIRSLAKDSDGNLWLGTVGGGVYKLAGDLIINYTRALGLPFQQVACIFEDRDDVIKAGLMNSHSIIEISKNESRLNRKPKDLPQGIHALFIIHSKALGWRGVARYPFYFQVDQPAFTLRNGSQLLLTDALPQVDWQTGIYVYQDEAGKLWVNKGDGKIYRADVTQNAPLIFEGFAADFSAFIHRSLMITDGAGGLWLGNVETLARLWHGKFVTLKPTDGLPETDPRCFLIDSRGWLWIGMRSRGVSMTQEPGAEYPRFINYSTAQGLSSTAVWSLAEDDFGRIYFGTDKGLDQFDPNTNQWRHYTSKDRLVADKISQLYKDHNGNIWAVTVLGLSKFNPRAERPAAQPAPIYFSRINIAGEEFPLPETGAASIPQIELAATHNNLAIEYVALSFLGEDNLRYQYQLEGVDSDWSPATRSRSVNYARLAPGTYRFLLRAINREGEANQQPAILAFVILQPVWQRWWFLTLAGIMIGLVGYALYRYRLGRLLELERVRTRIASDLHDDIGSSLSQIAILSEVLRVKANRDDENFTHPLAQIARVSREAVDSMSDIVWAINPQHDYLYDLSRRMRRFASELLPASNIEFSFNSPGENEGLELGADLRRQVFLIFKESVNNLARHSGCQRAEIALRIDGAWLVLRVSDDGKGLAASTADHGNGLLSMRRRAESLGGGLDIVSENGKGMTLTLKVPYRIQRLRRESESRFQSDNE
jgi:signal transduction histidine kinase/ligand-binding sensor domain-containing protein